MIFFLFMIEWIVIMKILTGTSQNLEYIGKEVEAGKIVAFPTDTVYGLGASITQKNSIKRIFDVKERFRLSLRQRLSGIKIKNLKIKCEAPVHMFIFVLTQKRTKKVKSVLTSRSIMAIR